MHSALALASCCMYFCLPNIINPIYTEQLREMIPPPSQNTLGIYNQIYNQITLLLLYYNIYRLVALLKIIYASIQVCEVFFILLLVSKFINFSFQVFLLFFLKCLLASRLTLFGLSTLLWLGSCTHCISACLR